MLPDAFDARTSLPRPLRVLIISAELAPFARAGGLGDVMQGLSHALGEMGVEVVVATPLYGVTRLDSAVAPQRWKRPIWIPIGGDVRQVGVIETVTDGDVRVLLLDCPPLFKRDSIYGTAQEPYPDNDLRFATLGMAALRAADLMFHGPPDIIHAHDWHAALAIAYARLSENEAWREAASVFTFHNIAYQGSFPITRAPMLGLHAPILHEDAVVANGSINYLKTGIVYSDRVTTVSQTYAQEVLEPEHDHGLTEVLAARSDSLVGITNGIDTTLWDPSRDRALAARYDAHDPTGRIACRTALAAELGLDMSHDPPIVGVVSRLTHQKGIDMLLQVVPTLVDDGMRLAIVAVGDQQWQSKLEGLSEQYRKKVAFRCAFGDPIARRVYAGADLFLMPSRFEPCGLGQQYAMRYGSVPVVNPVGGLADTVEPFDETHATGTGFWLEEPTPNGIVAALRRAVAIRKNANLWNQMVRNGMTRNASWDASARSYYALYRELVGADPRPSLP
ncbi:MAG TPA: glycogen synthase GlgA, partial [Polyangiaceae bacterium]|nr:glycogen synthase GlgA [Polyangiaceae bacterium]